MKGYNKFAGKTSDNVIDLEDNPDLEVKSQLTLKIQNTCSRKSSFYEVFSTPARKFTFILHETNYSTHVRLHKIVSLLYKFAAIRTIVYHELQDYLVANLKHNKKTKLLYYSWRGKSY